MREAKIVERWSEVDMPGVMNRDLRTGGERDPSRARSGRSAREGRRGNEVAFAPSSSTTTGTIRHLPLLRPRTESAMFLAVDTVGAGASRLDLREVPGTVTAALSQTRKGREDQPLHEWGRQGREEQHDHVAVVMRHHRALEQRVEALVERPALRELARPAEGRGVLEELLQRGGGPGVAHDVGRLLAPVAVRVPHARRHDDGLTRPAEDHLLPARKRSLRSSISKRSSIARWRCGVTPPPGLTQVSTWSTSPPSGSLVREKRSR
jgi:hypothetical protein